MLEARLVKLEWKEDVEQAKENAEYELMMKRIKVRKLACGREEAVEKIRVQKEEKNLSNTQ